MNQWQRNHLPIEVSLSAKDFISTDLSSLCSEALTHNISSSHSNEMMPWVFQLAAEKGCCVVFLLSRIRFLKKNHNKTKQNKRHHPGETLNEKHSRLPFLHEYFQSRLFFIVGTQKSFRNEKKICHLQPTISFFFFWPSCTWPDPTTFQVYFAKKKKKNYKITIPGALTTTFIFTNRAPKKKPSSLSWSTSIQHPSKKPPEFPDCPVPQMICTDVKADTDVPS